MLKKTLLNLRVVCCGLLLAFASLGASVAAQTAERDLATPKQQLPSPNGWDFFLQAGKARKGTPPHVDAKEPDRERKLLALEREYVAQNTETFRLIRQGLSHDVMRPRQEIRVGFSDDGMLRELGRLLSYKAYVEAVDKNWESSANSGLDAMHLGAAITRGATYISALTGNGIESIGPKWVKEAVPHLTDEQLQKVVQRLEKIESLRASLVSILMVEKQDNKKELQRVLQHKDWQEFRDQPPRVKAIQKGFSWDAKTVAAMQIISDEQILQNFDASMDKYIKLTQLPFLQQQTEREFRSPDALSDLLTRSFRLRASVLFARRETETRLLLVTLALRAYHAEHGTYPESLQALGGKYLQRIPLDPFDTTRPLGYRRDGENYVLYSVGPDGVDNHGTPIDNKPAPGQGTNEHLRRFPQPESEGDILADARK